MSQTGQLGWVATWTVRLLGCGADRAVPSRCTTHAPTHAGKRIKVEPLASVATPKLRRLLSALLQLVQGGASPPGSPGSSRSSTPSPGPSGSTSGKVSAMVDMDRCLKLQALVVEARQCLAPALRGGNKACDGRCVWCSCWRATVLA